MAAAKLNRRQLLAAAGALACAPAAGAQSGRGGGLLTVAQVFDTSPAQQDVSRDFVVGSRAFWQELNARGGIRGRRVHHMNLEVDGTPAGVRAAIAAVKDNPSCVVLSGTASDPVATLVAGELRSANVQVAHAAPWLQNSSIDVDDLTFPIFAARQEQITHALKSLTVMGVHDVGAVFATPRDFDLYREDIERTAARLKLAVVPFRPDGNLATLGQRLAPGTPAILLFVGGTPELVQFTHGLERQQRQRYIVALADVNLQTVIQMGGGRTTPLIVTQTVPLTTAPAPIVRQYREALARLFDEPPVPLSLAGYIAARYTYEVIREVEHPTRASVLGAFRKRASFDLGGYTVAFDQRRRAAGYVTQSMLTQDGRVIG